MGRVVFYEDYDEDDCYLLHYGTKTFSGRYPWGSGERPYQRLKDFHSTVQSMRKNGVDDNDIAKALKFESTTDMKAYYSFARNEMRRHDIIKAERLKDKGYSNIAIGKEMGINESQVRSLLNPKALAMADKQRKTVNLLGEQVEKYGMVDVGAGVESYLGITPSMKNSALSVLKREGYNVYTFKEFRIGSDQAIQTKILTKSDVTFGEVSKNRANITPLESAVKVDDYEAKMNAASMRPISVDPKRLKVVYAGEGGENADGVIYIRPGAKDLSMGSARYAQVRILVGENHYLKGMAVYRDDMPPGVDLMFNTSKPKGKNKMDALKPTTGDPMNPFGSSVRQLTDVDENGDRKVISALNIVKEEGEWLKYKKNLSAQFLSKQSHELARTQLKLKETMARDHLNDILNASNPVIKNHLLLNFAENADSDAARLKAAALPRQNSQVLLPVNSIKPTEVYAPHYKNGERVVLVRYPHGGVFELPELIVNNKNKEAEKYLGKTPKDAIGIHPKVAAQLSGADFDGDHVIIIPNDSGKIRTQKPLKALQDFDPRTEYPEREGMKKLTKESTQDEMGRISNLVTDMTLKGAPIDDIIPAIKHSMVVIDAAKHNLDYMRSYEQNRIAELKTKYQGGPNAGAVTLIARSKASVGIPHRRPRPAAKGGPIDPITGDEVWEETGHTKKVKSENGEWIDIPKKIKVPKMDTVSDANKLSSGLPMEKLYADYANELKNMARKARLESLKTEPIPYSKEASAKYNKEVEELDKAIIVARSNSPKERQAQRIANAIMKAKRQDNPDLDYKKAKKLAAIELDKAREAIGAKKKRIVITDKQWEAIQAGAISPTKLREIISHADEERLTKLALPNKGERVTNTMVARMKAMEASGYTLAEIAEAVGVSTSTVSENI